MGHIEELSNLYKALKHARHQRGAVEFESEETRFIFNAQRKIDRIVPLVRNDAHKIIEECMIQANVAAARYIEKNEAAALFRVHDRPGEERLTGFRDFLAELGLELKGAWSPSRRTLPTWPPNSKGARMRNCSPPCCCAPCVRPSIRPTTSVTSAWP